MAESPQASRQVPAPEILALQRLSELRGEFALAIDAAPKRTRPSSIERSLTRHSLAAGLLILLLVGGIGGWAAMTNIAGAIVSPGILVVDGGSQKVQHPEGGVVREILARDEDKVEAGQVLVRLDGTTTAASLTIVEDQLREGFAQLARLTAESTGQGLVVAPEGAGDLGQGSEFEALLATQKQLLEARAESRVQERARLSEQISQLEGQAASLLAQREAAAKSLSILAKEDTDLSALYQQGLVAAARLNDVRRERASVEGEIGRLDGNAANVAATIAERNIQIGQIDVDFRAQVMTDLQTVRQQIAELQQQRIAARDRLAHLDIRAPQAGTVHESIVRTVGGVVGAGETLMLVVPEAKTMLIEARLGQFDIDKVAVGQKVVLRFTSLDQRTTPELDGTVVSVAPDLVADARTGEPYYTMRVAAEAVETAKLPADTRLIPGMPVEAFIQTGDRSVLSYLLHPITEQFSRTFIER